jgi:hypothetical protein
MTFSLNRSTDFAEIWYVRFPKICISLLPFRYKLYKPQSQLGSSCNASEYSGGTWLESRRGHRLSWVISWFYSVFSSKRRDIRVNTR